MNTPDNTRADGLDDRFPRDPMMLVSMINMKLRDDYPDGLDSLCDDMGVDRTLIETELAKAGFEYNRDANKFW